MLKVFDLDGNEVQCRDGRAGAAAGMVGNACAWRGRGYTCMWRKEDTHARRGKKIPNPNPNPNRKEDTHARRGKRIHVHRAMGYTAR